jgi:hypothetical protein
VNWLSIFPGLPGLDTPFKANQDQAPVTGISVCHFKTCLKRLTEIALPFQSNVFKIPVWARRYPEKRAARVLDRRRPEEDILRYSVHRCKARSELFAFKPRPRTNNSQIAVKELLWGFYVQV